eukprot:89777-Prorocentrum_minimum.AAC.1
MARGWHVGGMFVACLWHVRGPKGVRRGSEGGPKGVCRRADVRDRCGGAHQGTLPGAAAVG